MSDYSFDFLNKKGVFDRVHLWLSYFGGKRTSTIEDLDRVMTLEVDEALLDGFYESGLAELRLAFGARYAYMLTLRGSRKEKASRKEAAESLLAEQLAMQIAADWLFVVGETEAAGNLREMISEKFRLLDSYLPVIPAAEEADTHRKIASPRRVSPI